ncbi:hypothetical protein CDAR_420831 [Caerostris darwini]|uniref:Uncharacterized protein n=1 Tax=Caerostris darwini TaxID=1538125 RepID=A0AAV4X0L2_9ARAC|nr:hypothetical protein CDAR_420831 [Caerostris darwini]
MATAGGKRVEQETACFCTSPKAIPFKESMLRRGNPRQYLPLRIIRSMKNLTVKYCPIAVASHFLSVIWKQQLFGQYWKGAHL